MKIKDFFSKLISFVGENETSIATTISVLVTLGGEQLTEEIAFNCPCSPSETWKFSPFTHSLLYLLLPACILFVLGLLVSNRLKRLLLSMSRLPQDWDYTGCEICCAFGVVFLRALIVPLAWIIIALLDGDFYVCMEAKKVGENELDTTDSNKPAQPDLWKCHVKDSPEYKDSKSASQIIAVFTLLGVVSIYLIIRCSLLCISSSPYSLTLFKKTFREAEQQHWEKATKELAENLASAAVTSYTSQNELKKVDWAKISKDDAFSSKHGKTATCIYSSLHGWFVEKNTEQPEESKNESKV